MNQIFIAGGPHRLGGASGELLGALSVWKKAGIFPTFMPTWSTDADTRRWITDLGCQYIILPEQVKGGMKNVPGLPGATVISFCNATIFMHDTHRTFNQMGCKIVFVPTMVFASPFEAKAFAVNGLPFRLVYQTVHQRDAYEKDLAEQSRIPMERIREVGRIIPAAFDIESWPFKPREHRKPEPFVIGKAARPDNAKWNVRHWDILERVPYQARTAFVMGLLPDRKPDGTPHIDLAARPKPDWANYCLPDAFPIRRYLTMIHAMAPLNPLTTPENCPRITYECFAHGVPIVAPKNSGWVTQIEHGETGYLCADDDETAFCLGELIHRPKTRMDIIWNARKHIEMNAQSPDILEKWVALFAECS